MGQALKNIAVFASGRGTNFEAVLKKIRQGRLKAKICLVVAGGPQAGIVRAAEDAKIPVHVLKPESSGPGLLEVLQTSRTDLILLAGFLKKIPAEVLAAFPDRIMNIHPALLPAFGGKGFYGIHVHEKVLEAGVKVTGVTVHFVDTEYDHGPIILQRPVEVRDDDTPDSLQKRVLKTEHDLYWRAVDLVIRGKVRVEGRRVVRQ